MVLTHLVLFHFFSGASSGTTPPTPTPTPTTDTGAGGIGSRRRRLRRLIRLRIQGQDYDIETLSEALEIIKAAKEEVPEAAEQKAREMISSGQRIGEAKKAEADQIQLVEAPSSVRDTVAERIAELERYYWMRIASALERLYDEEDEILLLQ